MRTWRLVWAAGVALIGAWITDVNNNAVLAIPDVCAGASASYKNERTETDQTVQMRVNVGKWNDVDIQGSYKVTK